MTEKKKLIEVALPLDAINKEAARENYIYKGNPSSVHKWWAQRPLAACRAVLFAQLVNDPSADSERFPTEESQTAERDRLFQIIERLVVWENSSDAKVLAEARAEILASCGGTTPTIFDPFAGGGSIPLEAQRLGLEAQAGDLNPVAVVITKALIELPARWYGQAPAHPLEGQLDAHTWAGVQGLADDVRYYGEWMREQASKRIGHNYPVATLPDGSTAPVIAWLWARTVTCPNPACRATMPLVRSFWLGKRKGKEAWVTAVVEQHRVRFEVATGGSGPEVQGTVGRSGATCLVCGSPVGLDHVRAEALAGRMRSQLMAVVAETPRDRVYLTPTDEHVAAANVDRPAEVPETELPAQALGFRVQAYGMTHHADLFTARQLLTLTTLSDLVLEAREQVKTDAARSLQRYEAESYADAVATYLAFAVSKTADYSCSLAVWYPAESRPKNLFARQSIPMVWDFPEVAPLSDIGGSFAASVRIVADAIPSFDYTDDARRSVAGQLDATQPQPGVDQVLCTDPPYYDNIGYADLADFFYVWLRRSLKTVYPELFATMLTPKSSELIATPFRFDGSRAKAKAFFEEGFVRTFAAARQRHSLDFPMTIFYAFKQSEGEGSEGTASTGWETMLQGLLQAGLTVTATWPMRTEREARAVGLGTNALASSIVLACRPRSTTAGVTDRRGFLNALKDELPPELRVLQQGSIAPVDLAQAAIGPGMAVFSRYAKVLEASGEPMRIRTALAVINQVLDDLLGEQEGDFDGETRWAIKWFEQFGMDQAASGIGDDLCRAYGVALNGLERSRIIATSKGKTRLLERSEMPDAWDPARDARVSIWEATQHLVKRLETDGELSAAALKQQLGGLADSAQILAYRLFAICEKRKWAKEAGPYNALAASWLEIKRIAESIDHDAPVAPSQPTLEGFGS